MYVKGRVSLTCNLHSNPDFKLFAGRFITFRILQELLLFGVSLVAVKLFSGTTGKYWGKKAHLAVKHRAPTPA